MQFYFLFQSAEGGGGGWSPRPRQEMIAWSLFICTGDWYDDESVWDVGDTGVIDGHEEMNTQS